MARQKSSRKDRTPAGPDREALRRHIRAKGAEYLDDPNITSVGIGRKNGDGPLCIQFTVGIKGDSAIEALGSRRIPEVIEVEGEPVPTDVIQRSYRPSWEIVEAEATDLRRSRADPLRPGISVAHPTETAGTLGLIVFDRATGASCILSNWHVLHGNRGRIGDPIVQPGPFDDNDTALNGAGTLLRSHLGAAGDCALARIRQRDIDRSVYGLDVTPVRMARVELGDRLVKSGRTTAITHGIVRRVDVMAKLDYGPPAGSQAIGCFEIGPDPERPSPDGEISKGGDSGAAWLVVADDAPTDIFAGLHFAGEGLGQSDEHALACYPASVQKKLDFVLEPPGAALAAEAGMDTVVPRAGYDPAFLGLPVPEPGLSIGHKRDAVNFGRAQTIPYTHFSVCLSARRRMARYVAWNVDGARMVVLPRRPFALDPRIDAKHQLGDELYAGNRLDRGHLARRADLCWGPVAEARQANQDSFYFPNIAPQHERFNQSRRSGLWGELENLILEQADLQDIRLAVQAGPVFGDEDTPYRGALIPRTFWKLIAYRGGDGRLRTAAFVLSQSDLLHDLEELDLDPFRIHQLGLPELARRTALDFEPLYPSDILAHPGLVTRPAAPESLIDPAAPITEIRTAADLRF